MTKALVILAVGLFGIYQGFRTFNGYESETEHLYGGDFVTLTCDADGNPVSGGGWMSISADRACDAEAADQRGIAKWWLLLGGGAVVYGYLELRKSRAKS